MARSTITSLEAEEHQGLLQEGPTPAAGRGVRGSRVTFWLQSTNWRSDVAIAVLRTLCVVFFLCGR